MADQNLVAVYDTPAHAEAAVRALEQAGVPSDAISRHAQSGTMVGSTGTATTRTEEKGFWASLFGGDTDDDTVYDRSMAGGATVVTVRVPEQHVSRVSEILEAHDPVDLDERASSYGTTTATTTTASTTGTAAAGTTARTTAPATTAKTDDDTIKVVAEQLTVGKRAVNRGGARIRSYVVETPVEEQVRLREETVHVERRPVNQPVGAVPADAFQEKVIETNTTAEEAVVGKQARVVEEIGLRKEATERVETVRDTVRRTEVEIEDTTGTTGTTRAAGTTGTSTTTGTDGTPGNPPGTKLSRGVDKTLGTNISGANPDRKA